MILFYVPEVSGELVVFPEEEARHCVQVLRRGVGDEVVWTDGKGRFFRGRLVETGKKRALARVEQQWADPLMRPFSLHVAIAPTKNIDRYEWFLEKATEIGIEAVTPIICQRSERKRVRLDRLERVLVAAMKQSFRGVLPRLHEPVRFDAFVRQHLPEGAQRMIATCQPLPERHLLDAWTPGTDLVVLIGPEGDFSPEEQELAHAAGFGPVQLGRARLRTETAGVLTAAAVALNGRQPRGDEVME